ncbi:MAG: lysozyme [Chromatiaceae bacterium]|jgi:lysozyme
MHVGQRGRNLFKEWEGLVTHEYLDSGGAPTIGIGHLLTRSERTSGKIVIRGQAVRYRDGLTEQQCWDLLGEDLAGAEKTVNDAVTVPLNQNQFDALASFTFNVGAGAFRRSTLLKLLNQRKYNEVPGQLRRWVRDNGHVVQGLINRREKEIALWNTPV